MATRTINISVLILGTFLSGVAHGQDIWRPYTEIEGRVGNRRDLGTFELFVPLVQDSGSMLFLNARGFQDDLSAAEGNWGLAYRTILSNEWIFGVNGFFDYRHTEFDNEFSQGGFGLELLDVNRGFRFNGYIPDGEVKRADAASVARIDGGTIVVLPGLEGSYYGLDIEAERLMWYAGNDVEVWAAAGVFHFDNNGSGFDDITGPRLRSELRMFDLPMLSNDSRLVFAGQYEYDDVRGSQATGMVNVRIPFGPGGGRTGRRLSGLARRMVAPIERDVDIVTNTALGAAEAAKIASSTTGNPISGLFFVDGNTADAEAVIEGAGADSVIFADGSFGTILPPGTIDMNIGQAIVGGGSGLAVIGCDTGATATLLAPGTRPTFSTSGFAAFNAAADVSLAGIDIVTSGDSVDGVSLGTGDFNVLLDNLMITTSGNAGAEAVQVLFGSTVTINNSTLVTTGDSGSEAVDAQQNSHVTINSTTITTSGGGSSDGVQVLDSASLVINNSNITASGDNSSGVQLDLSGDTTHQINNTTIISNTPSGGTDGDALELRVTGNAVVQLDVTDSTLIGNENNNGISQITSNNTSNVTVNLNNVDIQAADGPAIEEIFSNDDSTLAINFVNTTITSQLDDGIRDLESLDNSNLTATFQNSRVIVDEEGVDDAISRGTSSMTINIVDSEFTSRTNDAWEEFIANDNSDYNLTVINSSFRGATTGTSDEGVSELQANDDSTMNATFTNSFFSGGGDSGDGFEDIQARQNGQLTAVFNNCTFIAGGSSTAPIDFGEGIEDINAFDDSEVNLTFNDCTIVGAGSGSAIAEVRARDNATLNVSFNDSTLTSPGTGEAINDLRTSDSGTIIGSFVGNTITAQTADTIDAGSEDTSTMNVEFKSNTLSSGTGFFDFNLDQIGGTFNVVDFPTLSTDNNGATITTNGTINDIPVLP